MLFEQICSAVQVNGNVHRIHAKGPTAWRGKTRSQLNGKIRTQMAKRKCAVLVLCIHYQWCDIRRMTESKTKWRCVAFVACTDHLQKTWKMYCLERQKWARKSLEMLPRQGGTTPRVFSRLLLWKPRVGLINGDQTAAMSRSSHP